MLFTILTIKQVSNIEWVLIMPVGMVVVRWDNRIGTVLEAKQPKNYKISPDLTMRIYGAHVLGEERGPGLGP